MRLALPRAAPRRAALRSAALRSAVLPPDRAERLEDERLHARRQRRQVEADPLGPRLGRQRARAAAPTPPHIRQHAFEAPLGGESGTLATVAAALAACARCNERVPQQAAQRVVAQSGPVVRIPTSHRVGTLTLEGLAVRGDSGQEARPVQRAVAGRRFIQLAHELVEPGPLRALGRKHWRLEASGINHTAHREGIEACAERLEHLGWVKRRVILLRLTRRALDGAHVPPRSGRALAALSPRSAARALLALFGEIPSDHAKNCDVTRARRMNRNVHSNCCTVPTGGRSCTTTHTCRREPEHAWDNRARVREARLGHHNNFLQQ